MGSPRLPHELLEALASEIQLLDAELAIGLKVSIGIRIPLQLSQCVLARNISTGYERRQVRPTLVYLELPGKDVALEKPREYGFVMLPAVGPPAEIVSQQLLCLRTIVIDIVEDGRRSDPPHEHIPGKDSERDLGEGPQPNTAELPMDRAQVPEVQIIPPPRLRVDALPSDIPPGDDVANAVPCRHLLENRIDSVIGRNLDIRHRGLEERHLEVAKLSPVNDVGVELDLEFVKRNRDVVHGELRIPSIVEVNREGAQTVLLHQPRDIGAVYAATDTDDAVEFTPPACLLDSSHQRVDVAHGIVDIGFSANALKPFCAVVADATFVKPDVRVRRVHHAPRADFVVGFTHRCKRIGYRVTGVDPSCLPKVSRHLREDLKPNHTRLDASLYLAALTVKGPHAVRAQFAPPLHAH